jgi:hypothetical protein
MSIVRAQQMGISKPFGEFVVVGGGPASGERKEARREPRRSGVGEEQALRQKVCLV